MLRILIADDHAIVRHGVKNLIAEEFEKVTIGEAATGRGVLDAIQKQTWDVLILDLNLPDKNGLDVLKEAKAARPTLPVIVFSTCLEEQYALRALKAGCAGYLNKGNAMEELVGAIKKVVQGGTYISPSFAEHLAGAVSSRGTVLPHQRLSDREHQVLCLFARGKTTTEIADTLSLSVTTISTHRARLLEKLKLKTTADLIRYALDHKLVE